MFCCAHGTRCGASPGLHFCHSPLIFWEKNIYKDVKENLQSWGGSMSCKILGIFPLLLALPGEWRGACRGFSPLYALDMAFPILHGIWGPFYHAFLSLQVATSLL